MIMTGSCFRRWKDKGERADTVAAKNFPAYLRIEAEIEAEAVVLLQERLPLLFNYKL